MSSALLIYEALQLAGNMACSHDSDSRLAVKVKNLSYPVSCSENLIFTECELSTKKKKILNEPKNIS